MKVLKVEEYFVYPQGVCRIRKPACAGNGCAIFLTFNTAQLGKEIRCSAEGDLVRVFPKQKTRGAEAPHAPRFSRNASNYDLHEKAGGMPLPTITAPSIHHPSKRGREVCKQAGKSNVPIRKCGSKRTRYAPSRRLTPFIPRLPNRGNP